MRATASPVCAFSPNELPRLPDALEKADDGASAAGAAGRELQGRGGQEGSQASIATVCAGRDRKRGAIEVLRCCGAIS
jgi:hypothetical protein